MDSNLGTPESTDSTAGGEPVDSQVADNATQEATPAPEPTPTRDANVKGADVDGYYELKERMLAEAAQQAAEAEPSEQGEPAAEAEPSEPTDSDPEAPSATEDLPPSEPEKPQEFRPRLGKLPDRQKEAIALVREFADRGESISLSEAERRINLKYDGPEQPKQDSQPAEEAPPARTLESVKQEIAEWKAKRNEAIKDIDSDSQIAAEEAIDALREELIALQVSEIETRKQQSQQQQSAAEREWQQSQQRILDVYPVASGEHPIHAKAEEIVARLEATGNPAVNSSNLPFLAYQMAANELGIAPGAPGSPAPATNGKNHSKPSSSAPLKPQPVTQQAVVAGRSSQPAVAPGGARTSQPQGPTIPILDKITSLNDYEKAKAALGLPV